MFVVLKRVFRHCPNSPIVLNMGKIPKTVMQNVVGSLVKGTARNSHHFKNQECCWPHDLNKHQPIIQQSGAHRSKKKFHTYPQGLAFSKHWINGFKQEMLRTNLIRRVRSTESTTDRKLLKIFSGLQTKHS